MVLDDERVSSRHARLTYQPDGSVRIEDLNSTNGTYVNGSRIDSPVTLRGGEEIGLGRHTMAVRSTDAAEATVIGSPATVMAGPPQRPAPMPVPRPQPVPTGPPAPPPGTYAQPIPCRPRVAGPRRRCSSGWCVVLIIVVAVLAVVLTGGSGSLSDQAIVNKWGKSTLQVKHVDGRHVARDGDRLGLQQRREARGDQLPRHRRGRPVHRWPGGRHGISDGGRRRPVRRPCRS